MPAAASRAAEPDGQHFAHDLIVAGFVDDFLAEPCLERRRDCADLQVGVGLGEQERAIDLGGMSQISGAVEQLLHQSRSFVRTGIIEEVTRLGGRRDLADQVEVNTAQVFGVIRGRGALHLGLGPSGGEQAVDRRGERPGVLGGGSARVATALGRDWSLGSSPASRCHCPPWSQHDDKRRRSRTDGCVSSRAPEGKPSILTAVADMRHRQIRSTSISQSLIVRSAPPVARLVPSGAKAIPRTSAPWPTRRTASAPVVASCSDTSPSPRPDQASIRPSREKASADTQLDRPLSDELLFPVLHVPDPDRLVEPAGGQSRPVGRERDRHDASGVAVERHGNGSRLDVPELDLALRAGPVVERASAGRQECAVGREGDASARASGSR